MSQKSILLANEISSPEQVETGASIVIPIIFECARFEDQSVCAKPNGMCPSGAKCQRNEVCDMRFSHTDHLHLYKHGICLCADAK